MSYDDHGRRRSHVAPSSLILLGVFVGAAALMVYLAIYKPGFGDDNSATASPTAAAATEAAPTADPNAPQPEAPTDQAPGP